MNGSCLCGAVAFEFSRAVTPIGMCHCSLCRKASGAASDATLVVPSGDFSWRSGSELLRTYARSSGWSHTFCERCGSPMPQLHASGGAWFVPAGTLDDDPPLAVGGHIFVGSRARWDEIGGSAPQFEAHATPGHAPIPRAEGRPPVWVGHVMLRTPDIPTTRAFMLQLGLRDIAHGDAFAVLELRGGTHLLLLPAERAETTAAPFDLMVDDLEATHASLVAQGLGPSAIATSEIHRSFTVTAPSGHVLTFNSSHVSSLPV